MVKISLSLLRREHFYLEQSARVVYCALKIKSTMNPPLFALTSTAAGGDMEYGVDFLVASGSGFERLRSAMASTSSAIMGLVNFTGF